MPQEGLVPRLSWRVLDNNTGAVLIPDLPHKHQSRFKVLALQPGFPGGASIGDFSIQIPPPLTDDFRRWQAIFNLLTSGVRVEAFLGGVVTGTPVFSGIITKITRRADSWEIAGSDSLLMLQRSQLFPGEVLGAGGTALDVFHIARGTREVVWDDDFSGWNGSVSPKSGDYTFSNLTFTASDPQFGIPAVQGTATAAGGVTKTHWTAVSQYQWPNTLPTQAKASSVIIQGTMIGGTDTAAAVTAEILFLSDDAVSNSYMARALMRQIGATSTYTVDAEIWTESAGVFTRQANVSNVLGPLPTSTLPFEVRAVLHSYGTAYKVHLFINGKDTGCIYSFTTTPSPTGGGVGFRTSWNAGGSPTCYFNRIRFETRISDAYGFRYFSDGAVASGNFTLKGDIVASGQNHLDLMMLAASLDGYAIRKNAKYGYKNDTLDYGQPAPASPAVGADLTARVVMEEGVNVDLSQTELTSAAESFATDAKVNAIPGVDSGGNFTWSKFAAIGDAVLLDTVSDVGIPGYTLLAQYARFIQKRKANPLQAVQIGLIRGPNAMAPEVFRELDFITYKLPSFMIPATKAQVVGYTLDETTPIQQVWLNQLPDRAFVQALLARFTRPVEFLTNTYQSR